MNSKRLLKGIFATILACSFPIPVLSVDPLQGGSKVEIKLQTLRFRTLIAAKQFEAAEGPLAIISSLVPTTELGGLQAELALHKQNYAEAYRGLKLYFDGTGGNQIRIVSGAEKLRAWYFFLLLQNGEAEKAEKNLQILFSRKFHTPGGDGDINPQSLSDNKLAQLYMYLAGLYAAQLNFFRVDAYIQMAKQIDPKIVVDPDFELLAIKCGYTPGMPGKVESDETLPIVNYLEYQRKVGHPVKFN